MTSSPTADHPRHELIRRRRKLIRTGVLLGLLFALMIAALTAVAFSANNRGWNDESRVEQTQGTVIDEVRSQRGSCKGADFDTLVEWTQDGEARTDWVDTCRSGPDVGDEVDVWVRDGDEAVLRAPETTDVLIVVGIVFFAGLGALAFFQLRFGIRKVNAELAAMVPSGD